MTKKILCSIAAVAFAASVSAQARVGIKGGFNLSNISNANDGTSDNANMLPSWNAGVIADFPLSPILSLQPGVFYSTKGSKIERGNSSDVDYLKTTTNPSYIEIPVNFVGKIPLGADGSNKFFAGVGPYAAFGVAGKNKYTFSSGATKVTGESNIKWDDDTPFNTGDPNQGYDKYKRFDWGGNLMAGFEFGNVQVAAQYGLGFAKIVSGEDDGRNDKSKNRVLSFSVAYLFGGK
ncbi:PorT family protein [Chitinophaga sedimenti]|uniref:porin family protein n=1 Tax=Chitinophaga sedimenti TaxID=2033606 RepID=UPI002004F9BD|nr:porin family protein [Chitinophaga sedimenti]MCK7558778.1 PorT family protein [Chitinophaga sedimenti]